MSDNLIISLSFSLLAALCILGAIIILCLVKYNPRNATTEIDIPFFGKIKTDYPSLAMMFFGVVFAYFSYNFAIPNKIKLVKFEGIVKIDQNALNDISAIVVGVTTSPWTRTETPNRSSGILNLEINVPEDWNNYTAYAFAHGSGTVRPAVIGLRRDAPTFELDLKK